MRLTLTLCGWLLDIDLARNSSDDEPVACSLDGGTTGSQPVGFCPSPRQAWEDSGSLHQWDPDEADEDV